LHPEPLELVAPKLLRRHLPPSTGFAFDCYFVNCGLIVGAISIRLDSCVTLDKGVEFGDSFVRRRARVTHSVVDNEVDSLTNEIRNADIFDGCEPAKHRHSLLIDIEIVPVHS